MEEQMLKIKQNLKVSQDLQKSYVDKNRTQREFKVGAHVFLKVKANKSSLKLGNCAKLVARFCGPFEILERMCSKKASSKCIMCAYWIGREKNSGIDP
jgi:hypothetical protein